MQKIMNSEDIRCDCGSLIAKLNNTYIEMKCRRCKRLIQLALDELQKHGCTTHSLQMSLKELA